MHMNHMGLLALATVKEYIGSVPALTRSIVDGLKPESIPPAIGEHGLANVLCVTVWLFG